VIFPAGDQATEPVQPGKQALDPPASSVAAQRTAILCGPTAWLPVWRNQLDAVALKQVAVEPITVIGLVADQPYGQLVEEALAQDFFYELALVGRSALHTDGERKTVSIGDSNDLRALAAFGGADRKAPFFAEAKVASTKASSKSSRPCPCNSAASTRSARSNAPPRTHC